MQIIRNVEAFSTKEKHAVALGNFDGFHIGHKSITDKLLEQSSERGIVPAVVTFFPHPMKFFGASLELIMTEESKTRAFAKMGIKKMFILDFSQKFAEIDPEVFVRDYLVEKLNAEVIIVGYDYRFGKGRSGDFELLTKLGEKYGFTAIKVEKVNCCEMTVSSTKIRQLLLVGDVEKANQLLGRPFFIEGIVVDGNKIGRTLGFPTANIDFKNELIPKTGIYVSYAIVDGKKYKSVTNIGKRPTFDFPDQLKIETHILDFNAEIYGKDIEVELLKYIRPEEKFGNIEALINAINADCENARVWFDEQGI